MIDPFGRQVTYLRVSVTDRCDLRCTYCMAEEMTFLPKADLLSLEELERVCGAFIDLGVEKIRITGGEPLVRKNVLHLFRALGRRLDGGGLKELTLTTNGTQLARFADDLRAAGVRRINVSLDTLDADTFRRVSRWGDLGKVLAGLEAAKAAGLRVKINTVALRGVNDHEIERLTDWCDGQGFDQTFIETMPLGAGVADRAEVYLPLDEVRARLDARWTLTDSAETTGGPSRYVRVADGRRRIGFITPMSHGFCESCNRVRLTCTGRLYLCLGQDDHADLRRPLRDHPKDDGPLRAAIGKAIGAKPKGHDFIIDREAAPAVDRHMSVTGG
jgi:cyclic pyranopterin phosphate synthase